MNGIKAIQWGRDHEQEAIAAFASSENLSVMPTGFWLHECGFLGASPDGLVGNDAIVEVKCPYQYRDSSMMENIKHSKNYILVADSEGNVTINKNHAYYWQIQGQLYITKRNVCHLVVWTPKELFIVEVEKEDFQENILILQQFYLNEYIPFILGEKHVQ